MCVMCWLISPVSRRTNPTDTNSATTFYNKTICILPKFLSNTTICSLVKVGEIIHSSSVHRKHWSRKKSIYLWKHSEGSLYIFTNIMCFFMLNKLWPGYPLEFIWETSYQFHQDDSAHWRIESISHAGSSMWKDFNQVCFLSPQKL